MSTPISLAVGRVPDVLCRVMDEVGADLLTFVPQANPDIGEVGIICNTDTIGLPLVFSPPLPLPALVAFVTEHRAHYQAHFEAHRQAINQGDCLAMKPFWSPSLDLDYQTEAHELLGLASSPLSPFGALPKGQLH